MSKKIPIILLAIIFLLGGFFYIFYPTLKGVVPLLRPTPSLSNSDILPFSLPEKFTATLYAENLPGIRVLTRAPNGEIAASLTSEGKVVLLADRNGDHKADEPKEILKDLNGPHGIFFHCEESGLCTLYVAETNTLHAYPYNPQKSEVDGPSVEIMQFPPGGRHTTRTLLPHPDNKRLLVSIGSTCDVCEEKDQRAATIYAVDLKTKKNSLYASGLRNSVFMAIHPVTGAIWASEMGRDWLGDELPPDEINIIEEGKNYGWPFCYGKNVRDRDFLAEKISNCNSFVPAHLEIPAHSAPLGIAFVPEEGWPEEYWHDLFVAYHGSWNRSTPSGYKIARFNLTPTGSPVGQSENFMEGFFRNEKEVLGRPVALLAEPGGVLWISDDRRGALYRISLTEM